jgi:hypothetical protein
VSDGGTAAISIKELHARLTPHVLRSGVGEKAWNTLVTRIDAKSEKRQHFVRNFLLSLQAKEWKAVDETWNLPNATEEMWENMMNAFDDVVFPELTRLRADQRTLRERWLNFKADYKRLIAEEKTGGTEEAEE